MIAIAPLGNHPSEDDMVMRPLLVGAAIAPFTALVGGGCGGRIEEPDASGIDASTMDAAGRRDGCGKCAHEASVDTGSTPMCQPKSDLSGFIAPPLVPPKATTDACTTSELDAYYQDCLDAQATQQTCSAFRKSSASCASCLESQDTDATWGPLVFGTGVYVLTGLVETNYDGCLAKLGYTGCANDDFADSECTKFACDDRCQDSYAPYMKCVADANQTACKPYADKAAASCATPKANQTCAGGGSFRNYYDVITRLFCAAGD